MTGFYQLLWAPVSLPLAHATPAALASSMFINMSSCSCLEALALAVPSASSTLAPDIRMAGVFSPVSYLLNVTFSDKPSLSSTAPHLLLRSIPSFILFSQHLHHAVY